ncbi:MAG TPA: DnaJ C-terminal domain-containing protein, partial [Ktedonobacteraceae bacterium]|nr:DnaJ C-terminal domain-containing protein [Ktedonobacteraceae bacterium]
MAYQGQQKGDIRATLAVSPAEALAGTQRKLNLPGGRQAVVNVPAGTHNGQEIRLEGEGEAAGYGNERGALILTIAIVGSEQST